MHPVVAIAAVSLRRLFRDRSNLFFVILLPLLLLLLLGTQFGGPTDAVLAVTAPDGPTSERVVAALEVDGVDVQREPDAASARAAVASGAATAALLLPDDLEEALADGEPVEAGWAVRPEATRGFSLRGLGSAALGEEDVRRRAATTLVELGLVDEAEGALAAVDEVPSGGVTVATTDVDVDDPLAAEFAGTDPFSLIAPGQLLLFVFLTGLTGAAGLVQARSLGVARRVLAAPVSTGMLVAGFTLGQFVVSLTQALVVVVGGALLFGVQWGDPLGVSAVVLVFSAVSAGAGMLLGALLRTEEQVGGVAVPVGLALAAFGGSMLPLELFSDTARTFAGITPHAWGNRAFAELVRRDAGLSDVAGEVGVLLVFAVVLVVAGGLAQRRALGAGTT